MEKKRRIKSSGSRADLCRRYFMGSRTDLLLERKRHHTFGAKCICQSAGDLLQNLAVNLPTLILLGMMLFKLRKKFVREMYLNISGDWQKKVAAVLLAVLAGVTVFCLITKEDKVTILYNLLYYVIFTAFTEEFLIRDVCTWILRTEKKSVRYLVPNLAFGAMHLFSYANWGEITLPYVVTFVTTEMLGLVCTGCGSDLERRSGTIWLTVLLHGLMDYLVVLSYAVG